MRTSTLPPIRVEDEFRASVESVLREGETLTSFIETEVRRAVEHRLLDREFLQRAQAAWGDYKRTGVAQSVDEVVDRLHRKIEDRRKTLTAKCSSS